MIQGASEHLEQIKATPEAIIVLPVEAGEQIRAKLVKKLAEYKKRRRTTLGDSTAYASPEKLKDKDEYVLDASYKVFITESLLDTGRVEYEVLLRALKQDVGDNFDQTLFDSCFGVIHEYATGEGNKNTGGTGF